MKDLWILFLFSFQRFVPGCDPKQVSPVLNNIKIEISQPSQRRPLFFTEHIRI